ncbi:MAG: hypothetical protein H0U74_21995 [Bradymonadaceae bacterium]|nr:hypothetical protein [Lujinxingiaceae bacterium]
MIHPDKKPTWRRPTRWIALCLTAAFCLLAIDAQSADPETWLYQADYRAGGPSTRVNIRADVVADINASRTRVWAAVSHLQDEEIAQALVGAHKRGIDVRIVADEDHKADAGFGLLEAAGLRPTYGDGELIYLPDPTLSPLLEECQTRPDLVICTRGVSGRAPTPTDGKMVRPGHFNLMSHTFFVIDEMTVWNITTPLTSKTTYWLGFRMTSEEIARTFEREFRQMHGGVFATTLSVYNGPLKSTIQRTPLYHTDKGAIRIQFNPQERLIKNVIDEVYRAKASVYIMTEDLSNPFLIDALEYKKARGFEVRVVIGKGQGPTMLDRVTVLGAKQVAANIDHLPTMIIIDQRKDRLGRENPRIVQLLSHPLIRTAAFEVTFNLPNDRVRVYPSDTFVDGNMFEILEFGNQRGVARPVALEADRFLGIWNQVWSGAQ